MSNTKTAVKWIVGLSVLGGLTGIGLYLRKQYLLLYNSPYKSAGGSLKKITPKAISLVYKMEFQNQSKLSATLKKQKYDLFVNGYLIGKIENNDEIPVWSKVKSEITKKYPVLPFNIEIKMSSLLGVGLANIHSILYNRKNVKIKIKGTFAFRAGILSINDFPFETEFTLADLTDETGTA